MAKTRIPMNPVGENALPPPPMPPGTLEKVKSLLECHPWTYAKSMPQCPHFYSLRKNWESDDDYVYVYLFIRKYGVVEKYKTWKVRYLHVGGFRYWTMCDPEVDMNLINRAVDPPEPEPKAT